MSKEETINKLRLEKAILIDAIKKHMSGHKKETELHEALKQIDQEHETIVRVGCQIDDCSDDEKEHHWTATEAHRGAYLMQGLLMVEKKNPRLRELKFNEWE